MRKSCFVFAAAAAAALSAPAEARDNAGYGAVEGGAMWLPKIEFDFTNAGGEFDDFLKVEHGLGFDIGLLAGYDFGAVRAEAEVAYKRASVNEMGLIDPGTGEGFPVDGRAAASSAMINVLADFGADDRFSGYAGGGAGVTRVQYHAGDEGFASGFRDRDSAFAWQIVAGVRTAINPTVDVGLKYRFFNTGQLSFNGVMEFSGGGPFTVDGTWRSHSLLATISFNLAPRSP